MFTKNAIYATSRAGFVLAGLLMLNPGQAQASRYDISLRGLGRPIINKVSDPAVERYRHLSSELAMALAPRPLAPAESLGVSGFEFSVATIHADINEGAGYWQGQPGSPVFEGVAHDRDIPAAFWLPTIHIRKGLPMSSEIGVMSSFLAFSEMFMLGIEGKIALHESYFRWVPSVAVRTAFSSLFGNTDLTLTTGELDILASLPIGIGGMAQLTPYAGYGALFIDVTSGVIDETPYDVTDPVNDQRGGPDGSLYTFKRLEWQNNMSHRVFVGARINVAFLEVLYEIDLGIIGFSGDLLQSHSFKIGFDT